MPSPMDDHSTCRQSMDQHREGTACDKKPNWSDVSLGKGRVLVTWGKNAGNRFSLVVFVFGHTLLHSGFLSALSSDATPEPGLGAHEVPGIKLTTFCVQSLCSAHRTNPWFHLESIEWGPEQ